MPVDSMDRIHNRFGFVHERTDVVGGSIQHV
jgi:hypothetical protein